MQNEPFFESTHDALRFAFNYSSQQYGMTIMGKLMAPSIGNGKGLSGLDGAAQAGFIWNEIGRLSKVHQACITVQYAQRHIDGEMFGERVFTKAYRDAVEALTSWAVPSGVSFRKLRFAMVQKWAREPGIEFKALAEKFGINRNTVSTQYAGAKKRLDDATQAASCEIDDLLKASGMVRAQEAA